MNRKLLNDIRKSMCSRSILLKQKLIDGELSKPQRHNIFPRTISRFERTMSDKYYRRGLKNVCKKLK